jgi:enamine deaminase RidA (YjgF/YER057c/UK114 family)
LQELKEEGLIRAIGTTNFDTAHLRIAKSSGVDLVSNQISYSLVDRRGGGQMADYCAANGIAILAYGTLCGGFISKKWLGKAEPTGDGLSNWSLMKYKRFIDSAGGWAKFQNVLEVLNKVSEETDRSISTIASKYQLSQKAVGAVIIGARLGENAHIADAASLFTFELSKEQRKRIKSALDLLDPIPGDCGDEYRKPPYLTASGDLSHHLEEFPPVYKSIKSGSKERIDSGTTWETLAGYSRAVRIGDRVLVSGTTATHGELAVGKNDPTAQAHFIIDKIEASLESLGAKLSNVVRTRVFVNNMSDWEAISRAHGERFADIRPANTMFIAKLIGDEYLAEIEAEAVIQLVAE